MPYTNDRIKADLLKTFVYFDNLKNELVYNKNPVKSDQHHYMLEWNLDHVDEIEENIENRELSALCEAARELKMSVDDTSVWLAINR